MALENKVVLTCALTGIAANRAQCAAIPYTPAEIGEEARRAHEAGAAVAHIHAREDDGAPAFRQERYAEIMAGGGGGPPRIIHLSAGGAGLPLGEPRAPIRGPR